MKNGKLLLQLFLMFVVVLALFALFVEGPNYIGKSYEHTEQFYEDEREFRAGLTRFVLQPLSEEELRTQLMTVREEERNYYRTYYGTLAEQIQNITDQYVAPLEEASTDEVRELLQKEREQKIADIKANFADDAHVDRKILSLKEKAFARFLEQYYREKQDFLDEFSHYSYELKNSETNEVFKKGDVTKDVLHRFHYTEQDAFSNNRTRYIYLADYLNDGEGLMTSVRTSEYVPATFTGEVTISKSAATNVVENVQAFKRMKRAYYVLFALGVISAVLLYTKFCPVRADFDIWPMVQRQFARMPMDIFTVLWIVAVWFTSMLLVSTVYSVHYVGYMGVAHYSTLTSLEWLIFGSLSFVLLCAIILSAVWQYGRIFEKKQLVWQDLSSYKLWQVVETLFLNRTIGVQSMILLAVVFLAGSGWVAFLMEIEQVLLYLLFLCFIFLPVLYTFLRRMSYLNEIMKQTKDMAEGRLTGDLNVKGKSPLAKHAEHLNALRDGVRVSLNEQAKSERMKTELITNVSHDLRTPLTSIITYTDLLKNPELTEEERAKYIGILETKSARLKTLIEDLFEVSKMASGNMELVRTQVDMAQLLQQTVGEHEEDFVAASLDLRVTIAEQPIFAVVDGQKWWRVVDNLLVNARKYSLEGTRVYVQLKVVAGMVEMTVKNVAKYELNEDAAELVERFKRADTSRHTEGSGLGLAIAQSIVDLHGGVMKIEVDGDLFKVTVKIPAK